MQESKKLEAKRKFLHVVPSLHPDDGGPSRSVTQLTDAMSAVPGDCIISLMTQSLIKEPIIPSKSHSVERQIVHNRSRMVNRSGLSLRKRIKCDTLNGGVALIHSHGLWLPANHWACSVARQFDLPLIIQPRGMLEPWALGHHSFKKSLASYMFQTRDLMSAQAIVATSDAEYESVRSLGYKCPIAVIPNGIDITESRFLERVSRNDSLNRVRKVLFLSRIHPKKGLMNLIAAWGMVKPVGWRLQIAGPDESGHLKEVMSSAVEYGIDADIDILGPIDGVAKEDVYNEADIFVLPTFSENFGLVVAEALSHGLPVITTVGAPWADLVEYRCGWWVDIGVTPLANALSVATGLSDHARLEMGSRGAAYVSRYNWSDIALKMWELYAWLLDEGPVPDFVREV